MTTINLKDYYPWYLTNEYIEVTDEVAEALMASKRAEAPMRSGCATTGLIIPWTVMTGSNTPPVFTSPAPRSSWIARRCSICCGTPLTPCRKSRAAGWTLI